MFQFAFIALGSNLGDRLWNLQSAVNYLSLTEKILKISGIYESFPIGLSSKNINEIELKNFFNAVCKIKTKKSPDELLSLCQSIENRLGRVREFGKVLSRTIDLDIIFYGEEIIQNENLQIPHPKWEERQFVLHPLLEIFSLNEKQALLLNEGNSICWKLEQCLKIPLSSD